MCVPCGGSGASLAFTITNNSDSDMVGLVHDTVITSISLIFNFTVSEHRTLTSHKRQPNSNLVLHLHEAHRVSKIRRQH